MIRKELPRKLSDRYVGLPLTLVLDNARHQKCAAVRELAQSPRIESLYLPPYSPNPNLIERLRKFVKEECLSCRYHEDFTRFKEAIIDCLAGVEGKPKASIASPLTLRFQTFKYPRILAAWSISADRRPPALRPDHAGRRRWRVVRASAG